MSSHSRSDWGARPSRGGPGRLTTSRVIGLALHWPAMREPLRGVERVSAALRGWQAYHMDTHGWSDIGYQAAVDQDGNVYTLRGLGVQSGANGTADLNERYGAVLLVLAPGEKPSEAMFETTRRVIAQHRRMFPNSTAIVGHGQIRPGGTQCPGPLTLAAIERGEFTPDQEDDMSQYADQLERIENNQNIINANQVKILDRLSKDAALRSRLAAVHRLVRKVVARQATDNDIDELRDQVEQLETAVADLDTAEQPAS